MAFIFDNETARGINDDVYGPLGVEKGRIRFVQGFLLGAGLAGIGCFYYRKYESAIGVIDKIVN